MASGTPGGSGGEGVGSGGGGGDGGVGDGGGGDGGGEEGGVGGGGGGGDGDNVSMADGMSMHLNRPTAESHPQQFCFAQSASMLQFPTFGSVQPLMHELLVVLQVAL